jgi:gamma-glutamylcyclotransferase (GGCT)/AIG2-like uncharacterized protein YtfP
MSDREATPQIVAFYGSLRAGCAIPEQPSLAGRLIDLGSCALAGTLYDLGEYPGLVAGEGRVVGELHQLLDPSVIGELDRYEGYDELDPSRSEYVRRVARLIDPALDAWVYYFNGETRDLAPVPSGDWAEHIRFRERGAC